MIFGIKRIWKVQAISLEKKKYTISRDLDIEFEILKLMFVYIYIYIFRYA